MIEFRKAPPFATVQDLGWRIGRAIGLPEGGAMDRDLLAQANRAVGNSPGAAAIEWALGPGSFCASAKTMVCVLSDATVRVDGTERPTGVIRLTAGALVEVIPRGGDRFIYVAVRGGIAVPEVLGSQSTYLPGAFGGFEGRRLKDGDHLPVGPAPPLDPNPGLPLRLRAAASGTTELRVTGGPQWDHFEVAARTALFSGTFVVSGASDRMGYRLDGPAVSPRESATLPSEAACPGAVQIPDGGQPIVLMPDGPTVGGYPKIVVVVREDLGLLAQCQPGRSVRFREIVP